MATAKVILNGTTLMDVTADTVDTTNLLSGETATKNDGTVVNGSIANKSGVDYEFDSSDWQALQEEFGTTYVKTVEAGFYDGSSEVAVSTEVKTVTPSTSTQTITPTNSAHLIKQVTVNPIPSQYIVPSGTVTITDIGTVDVASYASAAVSIPYASGVSF